MLTSTTEVCIWGAGLVGYTLARALAEHGSRCVLVDPQPEVVRRINEGKHPFPYAAPFIADPEEAARGRLRAIAEPDEILDAAHAVHVLAIPTVTKSRVDATVLRTVVEQIARSETVARPLLLIIESTVAPVWIAEVVHATFAAAGWEHEADYHVGCSPRRDVFGDDRRTLRNIAKVYGADSERGAQWMHELYSPICEELHRAPDASHAALSKLVENEFRQQAILLANRLTASLPGYDIAEVLRLAATKWNVELYHPSLGIGGYCVPLAKDYLALSAPQWSEHAAQCDSEELRLGQMFLGALFGQMQPQRIGILGLAYGPGLRVLVRTPTLRVVRYLKENGHTVSVHDPYYSPEEVSSLAGTPGLNFPVGLRDCDVVLLMTPHKDYCCISDADLAACLRPGVRIVDNGGAWRERKFPADAHYTEVGGRGFLSGTPPSDPL